MIATETNPDLKILFNSFSVLQKETAQVVSKKLPEIIVIYAPAPEDSIFAREVIAKRTKIHKNFRVLLEQPKVRPFLEFSPNNRIVKGAFIEEASMLESAIDLYKPTLIILGVHCIVKMPSSKTIDLFAAISQACRRVGSVKEMLSDENGLRQIQRRYFQKISNPKALNAIRPSKVIWEKSSGELCYHRKK